MDIYASSVVDLWRFQQQLEGSKHSNPRDGPIKDLLKNCPKQDHERSLVELPDRSKGIPGVDGYCSPEEISRMIEHVTATNSISGLRNRLAIQLCLNGVMRGEWARKSTLYAYMQAFKECSSIYCVTYCFRYVGDVILLLVSASKRRFSAC